MVWKLWLTLILFVLGMVFIVGSAWIQHPAESPTSTYAVPNVTPTIGPDLAIPDIVAVPINSQPATAWFGRPLDYLVAILLPMVGNAVPGLVALIIAASMVASLLLKYTDDRSDPPLTDERFGYSVAHPREMAKGKDSPILVNLYLRDDREHIESRIGREDWHADFLESPTQRMPGITYGSYLEIGIISNVLILSPLAQKVSVAPEPTTLTFMVYPRDTARSGRHRAMVTINDSGTQTTIDAHTFTFWVTDYAFGKVSWPFLHGLFSIVSTMGAIAIWSLTLLGEIDQTLGWVSGSAAAAAGAVVWGRMNYFYRALADTKNFVVGP